MCNLVFLQWSIEFGWTFYDIYMYTYNKMKNNIIHAHPDICDAVSQLAGEDINKLHFYQNVL